MDNWPYLLRTVVLVTIFWCVSGDQGNAAGDATLLRAGPNAVDGAVEVDCAADAIYVNFKTKSSFGGNLYIKGRHDQEQCLIEATNGRTLEVLIPHLECSVNRQRSLNPRGIYISTTLVVAFHPQLTTEMDQVYDISCFHVEAVLAEGSKQPIGFQHVESDDTDFQLDDALIHKDTAGWIHQQTPVSCTYQVLSGDNADGVPARFTTIGQLVYHHWSCNVSSAANPLGYCMVVNSCFAHDPTRPGVQYELIDDEGCSVDRYLIGDIDYDGPLEAGRATKVFSFADRHQLHFQCRIRVFPKTDLNCPRPTCHLLQRRQSRGKRDVRVEERSWEMEAEVNSQRLELVDLINVDEIECRQRLADADHDIVTLPGGVQRQSAGPKQVCISLVTFSIVVTSTLLVAITTLFALILSVLRRGRSSTCGGFL